MSGSQNFVPSDTSDKTLKPSGNDEVNAARKNLIAAINFRDEPPFTDLVHLFNTDGSPDEDKMYRYYHNGCKTHRSQYSKQPPENLWCSEVLIAVRNDLSDVAVKEELPLFIDFHGGGFTTGDIRHGAWRQKHKIELIAETNMICVCPNYPVLPWFDGKQINAAIREFWNYIFSDDFKNDLKSLHPQLKPQLKDIIVSGDSAGAWLAMHSFLEPGLGRDPVTNKEAPLDISVVYMQYPMLCHYKREVPPEGLQYLGQEPKLSQAEITDKANDLKARWKEWHQALAAANMTPYQVAIPRPWAPIGVSASFLASCSGDSWKELFQNGDSSLKDIVERLEAEQGTAIELRARVPRFYIYHGAADVNVNIEDTKRALYLIRKRYLAKGVAASEVDEHIHFAEELLQDKGHGFDHNISVKTEEGRFIKDVHDMIKKNL
ncbi:hypothetical protein BU23DRAFT_602379 [Bimuria novae-zelandiae CBS 107.79]|uniref:Alpha/beta hydrolase fold-3 domain-containing protein n=1 Tax=Bimuria novae-zelandiae CBS 107.79 TaxID=1447943 RepID=A0A6A5V4G1_9PLEO|nr:hypothetical protein BU23DRAFT_602379 [Bimuria novae-zelandiae CBS 107.79]